MTCFISHKNIDMTFFLRCNLMLKYSVRWLLGCSIILFTWTTVFSETHIDTLLRNHVDLRFGMFLHFNMDTYYPSEWANPRHDPLIWNPTALDCGQWARTAKAAGMKYGVLTCKHHDGFVIWQSNVTPLVTPAYTIKQSSVPNMDVVKAYVDSFRVYGLQPGLYFSMYDVAQGIGYLSTAWTASQKAFILGQITELLTNYGEIPLFVFDGWSWCMGQRNVPFAEVRDTIRKLQPNCLVIEHNGMMYGPWGEDLFYVEEPKGIFCPAGNTLASCQGQTISNGWYTSTGAMKSVSYIVTSHLALLEPRYCNFLLNCPPQRTGLLIQTMVDTLTKVGTVWHPNTARSPLPTQRPRIEYVLTPSSATGGTNPANAIDGKMDYNSETDWTGTVGGTIILKLSSIIPNVGVFGYLPSQTSTNGEITTHSIDVSTDSITWTRVVNNGVWTADKSPKIDTFARSSARFVRLTVGAVNTGSPTASEFGVGYRPPLPVTSISNAVTATKTLPVPAQATFRTTCSHFVLPKEYTGKTVLVEAYNPAGRMLQKAIVNNRFFNVHEKFQSPGGTYILKVKALP